MEEKKEEPIKYPSLERMYEMLAKAEKEEKFEECEQIKIAIDREKQKLGK